MKKFIEVAYGVVFGANFYKFFDSEIKGSCSKELADFTSICDLLSRFTFNSEKIFFFLLFLFTAIIIAHDWYAYYYVPKTTPKKAEREENKKQKNFWVYTFQVIALVFVAQMFAAANACNLKYWYFFALLYTLFNCISLWQYTKEVTLGYLQYVGYIAVTLWAIWYLRDTNHFESCSYYTTFIIAVIAAVIIWVFWEKWADKQIAGKSEKQAPTGQPVINALEEIQMEIEKINTDMISIDRHIDSAKSFAKDIKLSIDSIQKKL